MVKLTYVSVSLLQQRHRDIPFSRLSKFRDKTFLTHRVCGMGSARRNLKWVTRVCLPRRFRHESEVVNCALLFVVCPMERGEKEGEEGECCGFGMDEEREELKRGVVHCVEVVVHVERKKGEKGGRRELIHHIQCLLCIIHFLTYISSDTQNKHTHPPPFSSHYPHHLFSLSTSHPSTPSPQSKGE